MKLFLVNFNKTGFLEAWIILLSSWIKTSGHLGPVWDRAVKTETKKVKRDRLSDLRPIVNLGWIQKQEKKIFQNIRRKYEKRKNLNFWLGAKVWIILMIKIGLVVLTLSTICKMSQICWQNHFRLWETSNKSQPFGRGASLRPKGQLISKPYWTPRHPVSHSWLCKF